MQKEVEYVSLSRDTTESDLKQRREIQDGTAKYIHQVCVWGGSGGECVCGVCVCVSLACVACESVCSLLLYVHAMNVFSFICFTPCTNWFLH